MAEKAMHDTELTSMLQISGTLGDYFWKHSNYTQLTRGCDRNVFIRLSPSKLFGGTMQGNTLFPFRIEFLHYQEISHWPQNYKKTSGFGQIKGALCSFAFSANTTQRKHRETAESTDLVCNEKLWMKPSVN